MDQKKDQPKALSDQQKSQTLDKLYQKLNEDSKSLLLNNQSLNVANAPSEEE